jgi:D-amino peptidase
MLQYIKIADTRWKMKKAFISADIEGIAGAVSELSIHPKGRDFNIARKRLARDVNAAARACFDNGFDAVTVCDAHMDMENLILEDMDSRIRLVSGAMRSSLQMQGIEQGYDAYISFGHSGAGLSIDGVLNHCYNSGKIYNMRFNGTTMNTETVVNTVIAGHYGVPLIAVIGDSAVVREVKEFVPNVEGVAVKEGFSRYCAISVHSDVAEKMIYDGVKAAINRMDSIKPLCLGNEITMEIDYMDSGQADTASLIPGVERVSPRTVRFTSDPVTVFEVHELIVYRLVDKLLI